MAENTRGAGRKSKLNEEQLAQAFTLRQQGRSVTALSVDFEVSRQTMSAQLQKYAESLLIECDRLNPENTIVRSLSYWKRLNDAFSETDISGYTHRFAYMLGERLLTLILADFKTRRLLMKNFTAHPLLRAFGIKQHPDWQDFLDFLESRCFPRTRDYQKIMLSDLGLPVYDPLEIVLRTGGRMAEDAMYLQITTLEGVTA